MNDRFTYHRWTNKIHSWLSEEGPWLHKQLGNLPGIKAYPSAANFQLIEGKNSLMQLRENLARKRILLRDCRSFNGLGENWLRISLQTRRNNIRITRAMCNLLS